ncbi:MAG: hypothetical protein L3J23_07380 [Flavobacteriaceae bacterium]|nr:hypothetical protein [Flavobacteriaceae bacterium]
MEEAFNKANPTYKNHRKIFFFGDTGGRKKKSTGIINKLAGAAKDFNTLSAVLFGGKRDSTAIHELLHCLGLEHSFDNKDYSFEKNKTQNIMDYSTKRNHLWIWQIKQLLANDKIPKE